MRYIDGHCDVLYKMWRHQEKRRSFYSEGRAFDVNYEAMKQAHYAMQTFAVWVPPDVQASRRLSVALHMIDLFHSQIVKHNKVEPVQTFTDIRKRLNNRSIGAMLALEGADAVQGEIHHLRIFEKLGVRSVGLTWNHANDVADGVEEERGGGLTNFGRQFVRELARLNVLLDVSHLSVRGFWDILEQFDNIAVYASHANAHKICPHVRNLDDSQLKALLAHGGVIGLTFVPWFLDASSSASHVMATPESLLPHLDHICSLGGARQVAFGSDFDGFTVKVPGLAGASDIPRLTELLLRYYAEDEVKGFMYDNWLRFYRENL